uniref:Transmembrane protein n=1 Tax=Meloidogyne incognita TaxID=6306 RepID=A0A914NJ46_MELIC
MSSKKPKGKFFDSVSDSTIDLQQLNNSDNNITSEDTNSEQTKIAETDRTILETNGGVLSPTPSQFKILTIEGNGNKKPINSSKNSNDGDVDCWNNPMLLIETFQIICKELIIKYKQVLNGLVKLGILLGYHLFLVLALLHDSNKSFNLAIFTSICWLYIFYRKFLLPFLKARTKIITRRRQYAQFYSFTEAIKNNKSLIRH